jgi:3-hydroxymyristoyl/3-hydroxydecanoyl-(acyl carrier protein) dehydratase
METPALRHSSWMSLPVRQLGFLDDVLIDPHGGSAGLGYAYGSKRVHPEDWYFACHFHQDPVMPGSLGLETVTQTIQAFALQTGLDRGLHVPRFGHVEGQDTAWKFRGQVLGDTRSVEVEVHITQVRRTSDSISILADASLWKEGLRIYEFKDVGVRLNSTSGEREGR